MKTKHILPLFAAVLSFGLAQAAPIVVSYFFDAENHANIGTLATAGVGSLTSASSNALVGTGISASSAVDMSNIHFTGWGGTPITSTNGQPWVEAGELSAVYRTSGNDGNPSNLEGSAAGPTEDPNGFLSFTITNESGSPYSITDFNFAIGWNRGNNTRIHYYADVLIEGTSVWNSGSVEVGPMRLPRTSVDHGYDLSNLSLSLSDNETAEFRLYTVHQGGSGQFLYVANMEAVVVPEPGTLALVGIALGSLLLFRRRSR
jgi:hypothetical protein